MTKLAPSPKRGAAGMLLLFCGVATIVGVGFEFLNDAASSAGVIAQPGARAVLGVGVVAVLALLALAMRMLLSTKRGAGDDAGDHA